MLVVAFGASVTQQGTHHVTGEVTGYVPWLKKILADFDGSIAVDSIGAGSSHFNDAGYVLLDRVIALKPDFLILDWHSTGIGRFDDDLWASAVRILRQSGIPTLITVLPTIYLLSAARERPNIQQARAACGDNIYMLNLSRLVGTSIVPEVHLRDGVHTNQLGAQVYAEIIADSVKTILHTPDKFSSDPGDKIELKKINESIPTCSIDLENDYKPCTNISLIVSNKSPGRFRIIADQLLGPFSPVAVLSCDSGLPIEFSIWDPSCHFTRQSYTALGGEIKLNEAKRHTINLTISQKSPDYSSCRRADFDFSGVGNLCFKIKRLFLIGNGTISINQ